MTKIFLGWLEIVKLSDPGPRALSPQTEGANLMTNRTTRKTVTFRQPFVLSGIGGVQPGTYEVDTDEESIDSLSILAYRRVATFMQVHRNGDTQVFPIDPVELDAALMRDAGLTVASGVEADEVTSTSTT